MDTEGTTGKLCILVPIEEESCFLACNKIKAPAALDHSHFPHSSFPKSLTKITEILGVGQEANPKWKNFSYSPGRGNRKAAPLVPSPKSYFAHMPKFHSTSFSA